jgi:D-alanyl-D-alanine carboxypeptidase
MNNIELGKMADRSRFMREAGIALLLASAVLSLFLLIPLGEHEAPLVVETATPAPNAYERVEVVAEAAIVYDLVTGEALFEKNSDAQLPLASLTKLLGVEAAVQKIPRDLPITITEADLAVESPQRFKVGDTLLFEDLARLTLTASLNDGAAAIIRTLAEREATTTPKALQAGAAALGLASTYAVNGNGLDVSGLVAGGYGSARDMALLAGALVRDAGDIALATTLPVARAESVAGNHYEIYNTNPTVTVVPRLLLSKTGFTDLAGGNLALVFDAAFAHPIAIVVLGSTENERFTDATALMRATLAHLSNLETL